MPNDYEQAIENLYASFGDVPRPIEIDGCPCCSNPQELAVLVTKPLRELTADDLRVMEYSAPWTVGTWVDYCYFFPRMLELSLGLDGHSYFSNPEMLISRLGDGRTFTAEQLQALENILHLWWSILLHENAEHSGSSASETLLACVPLADLSLAPFLQDWQDLPDVNAAGQLAHFIRFNWEAIAAGGVWNTFLDDEHTSSTGATERKAQASATVREWLQQPVILERLRWLITELEDNKDYDFTLESAHIALQLLQNPAQDNIP